MDTIYQMDTLPDGPGKFLPLSALEIAEGMAASAATAIARLGGAVALWAATGDDDVGSRLLAAMEAEGIDCTNVQRVIGAPSAVAAVLVDRVGERMIVPYYAPALFGSPKLPAGIGRGAFAAVMADVRWPQAAELALAGARDAGVPAILDADVGPIETIRTLAALASHVVASASGAALLTDDADPAAATRALAARCAGEVVVTAGELGCYWFDRSAGEVRHLAAPKIDALDTTAAGDVFHGGFALALVEGRALPDALRFGTAAAALKCTRFGGRLGAPNRAETDAFERSMQR